MFRAFLLVVLLSLPNVFCFHESAFHTEISSYKFSYQGNTLELNLLNGGKIMSLILTDPNNNPHHIIKATPTPRENFTSNGCFMMYPWVNRLDPQIYPFSNPEQKIIPDFLDDNGIAIHGLFSTNEREVVDFGDDYVAIQPKNYCKVFKTNPWAKKIPKFIQWFQLRKGSFTLMTEFYHHHFETSAGLSFGYHPYLQLDDVSIDEIRIKTNMTHVVKVDEKLLPIPTSNDEYQYMNLDELIDTNKTLENVSLDNCLVNMRFHKGDVNFLDVLFEKQNLAISVNDSLEKISGKLRYSVKGKKKINMRYFQVYTPIERKRLAVEPQNTGPNSYYCEKEELVKIKPWEHGRFGLFNIELKNIQ